MLRRLTLPVALLFLTTNCLAPSAQTYVERGNRFFDEGRFEDASINYRKALQKNPHLSEAMYRLALADIKVGRIEQAYSELNRAKALSPQNQPILVTLADLCLAIYTSDPSRFANMYEQAVNIARELKGKPGAEYDAARLGAYLSLADNKPQSALELLRQANSLRPMQPEVLVALLKLLSETGAEPEMNAVAAPVLSQGKNIAGVYDVLYAHYIRTGQAAKAQEVLQKRVQVDPTNPVAALNLCRHYSETQQTALASSCVAELNRQARSRPRMFAMISDFWVGLGKPAEALNALEQGITIDNKDRHLYAKKMAAIMVSQSRYADAAKALDGVIAANPSDVEARLQRSQAILSRRETPDVDRAIADLKEVLRLQPSRSDAHASLGAAYAAQGRNDIAGAEFATALRLNPNFTPAQLALSRLELLNKNFSEALRQADLVLARDTANVEASLVRSAALIGLTRYATAQAELQRLLQREPGNREAAVQLGFAHMGTRNYSAARAVFERLYAPGHEDVRPVSALAEILIAENQVDKALALLESEANRFSRPHVRAALIRTAVASGRYNLAIAQFEALPQTHQANLLVSMAIAYEGVQNRSKAIEVSRRAIAANPENFLLRNNLAFLLAEAGADLDEALSLVQQAQKALPNSPVVADTLGWVYLKKERPQEAASIFANLTTRYPSEAIYHYHLGLALLKKGAPNEAANALRDALRNRPSRQDEKRIRSLLLTIANG